MADWYTEMISPLINEAQMISVGNVNRDCTSEYRNIESSVLNDVFDGLESYFEGPASNEEVSVSEQQTSTSDQPTLQAETS